MKNQIILLVVVIFVSVYLLSLLVKYEVKNKKKQPTKPKEKVEATKEVEEVKEPPKEEKKPKENVKTPPISIALLDELHEFQNYLKERITPETATEENSLHPYETPKFGNFDDMQYQDFDEQEDFSYLKKRREKKTSIEDLPNEIKILMMTDFFDTKF